MINTLNLRILALAGTLILLFTLGLREIAPGPRTAPDYDGKSRGPEVVVHIEAGMSGSNVGEILEENGVVKSALAYFRAAVANPESERIAPGEHRIEQRIPAREAIRQLLDADRIVNLVKIRDGARVTEVVEELVEAGFKRSEITSALSELTPPAGFKLNGLEGFLYPAFYSFPRKSEAKEAISAMIARFQESTSDFLWKYEEFGPDELLIIGSLIELEGTPDVFSKVARVIYNRLSRGMKLQFDSTIHYIKNERGNIALSFAETKIDSKYNTYLYQGLPPGPIGSPSRAAIQAALTPANGDWLYFVTVLPGETRFTSSYDEFLKFKAEYKRNYRNGAFE
ncbi:MAG: hypothetical protein RLZZ12_9 [Actinomycetota bacterium]|jgi:UPF0755 protein